VALTYRATADVPARFRNLKVVGAVFGLTPSKYQSGENDWTGGISRCGDEMMRTCSTKQPISYWCAQQGGPGSTLGRWKLPGIGDCDAARGAPCGLHVTAGTRRHLCSLFPCRGMAPICRIQSQLGWASKADVPFFAPVPTWG